MRINVRVTALYILFLVTYAGLGNQVAYSSLTQRLYIGVSLHPVTPAIQKSLGLKDRSGAIVSNVTKNSPASRAKIMEGDVIRSMDGKAMKGPVNVQQYVRTKPVGALIKVVLLRNGTHQRTLVLKVGGLPTGV